MQSFASRQARAALVLLAVAALAGCGLVARGLSNGYDIVARGGRNADGRIGHLSAAEKKWAKTAWRYFENNTSPVTGLVNGYDRYPTMTMWQAGDYLAAIVAARELGLIDGRELEARMSRLISFLNTMELTGGKLPNKVYDTSSGAMVNEAGQVGDVGWSAMDIGRLLVWMRIAGERHPQFREDFEKAVLRWSFCDLINACGALHSGTRSGATLNTVEDGRFGTGQYAASGYALWGFETLYAQSRNPVDFLYVYDLRIPYDSRDARETGIQAPVTTLPWGLFGIEYGWRVPGAPAEATGFSNLRTTAQLVYQVQEARFRTDGILTARTDHRLEKPPYFVHDSILASGFAWNTIGADGEYLPRYALVSTKAAFLLWVLWKTDYTDQLIANIAQVFDNERGWHEGRYERVGGFEDAITLETNAVVLESLLYKIGGPIHRAGSPGSDYKLKLNAALDRPKHCFPPDQGTCTAESR